VARKRDESTERQPQDEVAHAATDGSTLLAEPVSVETDDPFAALARSYPASDLDGLCEQLTRTLSNFSPLIQQGKRPVPVYVQVTPDTIRHIVSLVGIIREIGG
jgi:hypothetical protein